MSGLVSDAYMWLETAWPYSERALFTLGTYIALTGTNLVGNGLLAVCYHFSLFQQYRIQKHKFPPWDVTKRCLIETVLVGAVLLRPLLIWFAAPLLMQRGLHGGPELPSLLTFAWQLAVAIVFNNIMFYWVHRALHHRSIYRFIHKQHHQFKTTIGIAAEHAHPVEQLLANAIPLVAGPLVVNMHFVAWWAYLIIREYETIDAHSGYDFPWSPFAQLPGGSGADFHDYHHLHFNKGNYGGAFFRFWDRLCGTDVHYREFKRKQALENKQGKAASTEGSDKGSDASSKPKAS